MKWARKLVRRYRNTALLRRAATCAEVFLQEYWTRANFDFEENGERWLIRKIAKVAGIPAVVFDVGANVGEYARMVAADWPNSLIHCFELVPETAAVLGARLQAVPGCVVNAIGLSDREGSCIAWHVPGDSGGSGITRVEMDRAVQVSTFTTTGDKYCESAGVEQIGLLKMDIEGHELSALKGFEGMLSRRRVQVIQFEYGITHLAARTNLRDIYGFLGLHGFAIGRLLHEGVAFDSYDAVRDESHIMGNYVASLSMRSDIIEAISVSRGK